MRHAFVLLTVFVACADMSVTAQATLGRVKGRLFLADGKTPAHHYVVAVQTGTVPDEKTPRDQWRTVYRKGALKSYTEAEVAADGTFVLEGLAAGKYALDVRRPGEREAWGSIYDIETKSGAATALGTLTVAKNGWRSMFDRTTLAGWKRSDFFSSGAVRIDDDCIVMEAGNDMTGVTWTKEKDLPRVDYEVTLQARRVSGRDFFCGLTFPVKKDPCTLILGGWGGTTVGLSSLDSADASMNETTKSINFENQRWYRVRLRVTQLKIEVWLDEERIIDVDTKDRRLDIRVECEASKPFGIATWRTTGAVRDLRLRKLEGAS